MKPWWRVRVFGYPSSGGTVVKVFAFQGTKESAGRRALDEVEDGKIDRITRMRKPPNFGLAWWRVESKRGGV
jgi:hypothetical protein